MSSSGVLRQSILDHLRGDPGVDASRIQVHNIEDVVVLDGSVRSYAEKCLAEHMVKSLDGVGGVRNRLEVRLTVGDYRTDATLERVLRELLEALARMPDDLPRATVRDGWVTLEGTVPHAFQKKLVEETVCGVAGIRGLTNAIVCTRPCSGT